MDADVAYLNTHVPLTRTVLNRPSWETEASGSLTSLLNGVRNRKHKILYVTDWRTPRVVTISDSNTDLRASLLDLKPGNKRKERREMRNLNREMKLCKLFVCLCCDGGGWTDGWMVGSLNSCKYFGRSAIQYQFTSARIGVVESLRQAITPSPSSAPSTLEK